MCNGIIAKKLGMSRVFDQNTGDAIPVTYLQIEPNVVVRLKTEEKDGYNAVILGVGAKEWTSRKGKKNTRYGHQKEWKVESLEGLAPGKHLSCEKFTPESKIIITGTSKGKGFQGVVRRHHFSGGPGSHGSHHIRRPGSIGMRERPGRVHKGKRMPGRMGQETVTLRDRTVVSCDTEKGVLTVKGPIPGPTGSLVYLTLLNTPA